MLDEAGACNLSPDKDLLGKIAAAVACIPEALVLWDENDRLMFHNEQYLHLCPRVADLIEVGASFEFLVRESIKRGQFIIEGDPEEWIARRMEFHRRCEGYSEQQLDTGEWVRMSERRAPWGGIICIRSDLTPLKQREIELRAAKEQAEAATAAKSRFLAVISHEMRTPMNGVLGLAQSLARGSLTSRQRSHVETIISSSRALVGLLDDILDISRIEQGQLQIETRPVQLRATLDEIVHLFEAMAKQKDLALSARVADDVPSAVLADPLRLRQILINLVNNALKFTQAGFVEIGADAAGAGRLRLTVKDSGPGIDARGLDTLFQPFSRIEPAGAMGLEGAGLGLAICKQLAEAMGGCVGVESRVGGGSVFWVELATQSKPEAAGEPIIRPAAGTSPLRVLVVDDDPINVLVARALLEQLGHHITVRRSGAAALRLLARQAFDVVLLDIAMPGEDGVTVARRVRRLPGARRDVPILAMTAKLMPESIAAYEAAGINGVVRKPIILEHLEKALAPFALRHGTGEMARLRSDVGAMRFLQIIQQSRRAVGEAQDQAGRFIGGGKGRGLQSILHRLSPTANLLGFSALAEEARRLEALLEGSTEAREDLAQLHVLLSEAAARLDDIAGHEQVQVVPPRRARPSGSRRRVGLAQPAA
jgi:signal transduction histidine kinase/DNA-binding response OmpR family regulator